MKVLRDFKPGLGVTFVDGGKLYTMARSRLVQPTACFCISCVQAGVNQLQGGY